MSAEEYVFGAMQLYVDVVFIFTAMLGLIGSRWTNGIGRRQIQIKYFPRDTSVIAIAQLQKDMYLSHSLAWNLLLGQHVIFNIFIACNSSLWYLQSAFGNRKRFHSSS